MAIAPQNLDKGEQDHREQIGAQDFFDSDEMMMTGDDVGGRRQFCGCSDGTQVVFDMMMTGDDVGGGR